MRIDELEGTYYSPGSGDITEIVQYHANGSDEQVGKIRLRGPDLDAMIFLLGRLKDERDRWNQSTGILKHME